MAYAAKVDEREGLFEFSGFKGLRNNVTPEMFTPEDLQVALNVDISDAMDVSRRKGYSPAVTSAIDRDIWAEGNVCLGVGTNTLKQMHPNYTTTTLRSGLTPSRPLSYASVAGRVFWSNGVETGCVQDGVDRSWGLEVPGMVVAAAGPGALDPGLYQCVVTFIRNDMQESGASKATAIELTATGGIALSSIPVSTDPTVTHKAIYCTSVGGETLYRAGVIANSATVFAISESQTQASPLLTQFLQPAPAADFIGYWNGLMLVAKGNRLYPSEPFAPELFDIRKSVPFLGTIAMVAPVTDGVWIGTDTQIIWLAGASPEKWTYRVVASYGAIPGCLAYADSELLAEGQNGGDQIAFFATKRGLCMGDSSGGFTNLTQARYAYPSMDRGGAVVRRHRGTAQFVVTLSGTEVAGNAAS